MNEFAQKFATAHSGFAFLTNHAHVLLLIAREPDVRMRALAVEVGITERAVQRIVDELAAAGYLSIMKEGRRNRYRVQPDLPMRNSAANNRNVGDLIRFVYPHL